MDQLKTLFTQWAGIPCTECLSLGANGSSRHYYRLVASSQYSVASDAAALTTDHQPLTTITASDAAALTTDH